MNLRPKMLKYEINHMAEFLHRSRFKPLWLTSLISAKTFLSVSLHTWALLSQLQKSILNLFKCVYEDKHTLDTAEFLVHVCSDFRLFRFLAWKQWSSCACTHVVYQNIIYFSKKNQKKKPKIKGKNIWVYI